MPVAVASPVGRWWQPAPPASETAEVSEAADASEAAEASETAERGAVVAVDSWLAAAGGVLVWRLRPGSECSVC